MSTISTICFVSNQPIGPREMCRMIPIVQQSTFRPVKLIADGNKYVAGVTSLGDKDVRLIIREIFQDPINYGKVSFPTAAKSTDLRPYTKGTLLREDLDSEEDLDDDDDDDEIEDLDRALPPEATTDEAFEAEDDDLDEA